MLTRCSAPTFMEMHPLIYPGRACSRLCLTSVLREVYYPPGPPRPPFPNAYALDSLVPSRYLAHPPVTSPLGFTFSLDRIPRLCPPPSPLCRYRYRARLHLRRVVSLGSHSNTIFEPRAEPRREGQTMIQDQREERAEMKSKERIVSPRSVTAPSRRGSNERGRDLYDALRAFVIRVRSDVSRTRGGNYTTSSRNSRGNCPPSRAFREHRDGYARNCRETIDIRPSRRKSKRW